MERIKNKILVIGDSCRDIYTYCISDRMAPDKPVPVLEVVDHVENPGMAKNVYENIKSLNIDCDINTNYNWYDVTKTRYVHKSSNHMFFRIDSKNTIDRIDIDKLNYDYETIVISDYDKGFLTEEDIETICSNHQCTFLDTKKMLGSWADKASFIKINNYEYDRSKKYITKDLKSKIIQTCGGDGCLYNDKKFPVKKSDVIDLSGAGDSFLAALSVKYTKTKNIDESIKFANKCASEVVKHKGVTII